MTEEEWLQGVNVGILIEGLRRAFKAARTKAGKRRLRLFASACLRRVWDLLEPESREILDRLEAVCDGREPEYNLKTLIEMAESRSAFHWSKDDWDVATRHAVAGPALPPSVSATTAAVSVHSIRRIRAKEPGPPRGGLVEYHRLLQEAIAQESAVQVAILRDIFGNPFAPFQKRGFPAELRGLAKAWSAGDTKVLPVLIDALTDFGEEGAAAHLRQPLHVRGCHVIDWVIGRA
ncbi:MAG: hypothetical protein U0797_18240 [Gemmataceae bacterium]